MQFIHRDEAGIAYTNPLPIKSAIPKDQIEPGALNQLCNLSHLPFAFHHIAVMPDVHQGYGMPIGGVLATDKVIVPNAVGVDIGCGMIFLRTGIYAKDVSKDLLKKFMKHARDTIPLGFKHHKKAQNEELMPILKTDLHDFDSIVIREYENARKQIGTLGGGNHFIEFQKDDQGMFCIMIHSGSRNLGYKVAEYYNKKAKILNARWYSVIPPLYDLAYLPIEDEEAKRYISEMQYCIEFAKNSRSVMMTAIMSGMLLNTDYKYRELFPTDPLDVAHNYARFENHFGKNVIIHRKGATSARKGELGVIPGSQGTKSYIVSGLGNPDSFNSCSHGAGRVMSRTKARENLNLEEEIKRLDDLGIIHGIRNQGHLDEAASAYKDIDEVMKNQEDLVKIIAELTPLAVIKGE